MARKRKKKKSANSLALKEETVHTISAIALLALGLLFILASAGLAGLVGNKIFDWLYERSAKFYRVFSPMVRKLD